MDLAKENTKTEPLHLSGALRKRVSIQGYEGCFHQVAAYHYFGEDIDIVPCSTFREVTNMVESGEVDAGMMAIENSIAGSILPNYSLLQNCSLKITGEILLLIRQNLMALPGVGIEDIKEIHSHPMALLQCINYIEDLSHPKFKLVETVDTALSARELAENHITNAAAIAGELAAKLFGLKILAPDIHTVKNNYTRFLAIERADKAGEVADADKASFYFKVPHKQNSLLAVLRCFEQYNINMTKLQSYPIPSDPFRYLFHVDVEFDDISDYERVIENMPKVTEEFCICGKYKRGDFIK
ncbi:MAG TPA: prephenate dehydratase [Candidatus Avirikenella pullistercoris]|nr:prephenate dehydratase [Candidatus Avirikenella pullistercoris]